MKTKSPPHNELGIVTNVVDSLRSSIKQRKLELRGTRTEIRVECSSLFHAILMSYLLQYPEPKKPDVDRIFAGIDTLCFCGVEIWINPKMTDRQWKIVER